LKRSDHQTDELRQFRKSEKENPNVRIMNTKIFAILAILVALAAQQSEAKKNGGLRSGHQADPEPLAEDVLINSKTKNQIKTTVFEEKQRYEGLCTFVKGLVNKVLKSDRLKAKSRVQLFDIVEHVQKKFQQVAEDKNGKNFLAALGRNVHQSLTSMNARHAVGDIMEAAEVVLKNQGGLNMFLRLIKGLTTVVASEKGILTVQALVDTAGDLVSQRQTKAALKSMLETAFEMFSRADRSTEKELISKGIIKSEQENSGKNGRKGKGGKGKNGGD